MRGIINILIFIVITSFFITLFVADKAIKAHNNEYVSTLVVWEVKMLVIFVILLLIRTLFKPDKK